MAAAFVNHVFFVLPVVENAYGIAARAPIMPLIAIDSIVLFTGTIVLIEAIVQDRFSLKTGVLAALRTPYVLAVLAGLAFNFAGLRQPEGLAAFTGFLGAAASPAALFALGIVLSRMRILGRDPLAWAVCGIKVVVHPLLAVLLFAPLLSIEPATYWPALLVAAGPAGAMAMALALHYRVATATLGRVIVLSTLGSAVGLSLLI